ncbi:DUF3515 domain-containing protein [Georgenia sunbinii]|uniref:DUF3515 domain-containing protein n=1 Tax=Georgenia sunbinii TaxID=3117728 RepID=UPI002F2660C2
MRTTTGPAKRRAGTAIVLGATAMLLAGCADPVSLPPATYAADPACAEVLQVLPGTIGDAERRSIGNQATAAWGDPPISLRCGVEPPPPTTERCITVEADGTSIDWLALEGDDPMIPEHAQRDDGAWTFITYGRVPAIEVVVPTEQGGDQPTAVLVSLGPAVELSPAERHCVGVSDVY